MARLKIDYGIDLGTTNSAICRMEKGEPVVIKTDVLKEFKDYCKQLGYPMNLILDCFMEQFKNGEFNLKIGKNNKLEVDIDE